MRASVGVAIALACTPLTGGVSLAAVVGKTTPAAPLTRARLRALPAAEREAWAAYLVRSDAARRLDEATLEAERTGGPIPAPPHGDAAASMPLKRAPAWYATSGARHVADVIVSFQTPAGGWGKNEPRSGAPRQPGQPFTGNAGYVGTLDNGATVTELRFLARVIAQAAPDLTPAYRQSFARGVRYLLSAQYPNGGWPQVWPLVGGYHDAVTFNDGALLAATRLMGEVARGAGDFAFVDADLRRAAAEAWKRGLGCIVKAQVVVAGRPSGWPQQSDALTLEPAGARNFEPRALTSTESAEILLYLMSLSDPSPSVVQAVHGGAAWLARAALAGKAWSATDPVLGRRLVDQPGAPPLWSRFYDLETGRPIFGDRDLTIHDDVNDLIPERRNGYAWFTTAPTKVLARYAEWAGRHPPQPRRAPLT